jgi:hypothetical protein
MSATTTHASAPQPAARAQVGEWFWRFLAVVMLIVVAWVVWIAIQISPPEMVLPAAYEAAAKGRARNSGGVIGGVAGSPAVPSAPETKEPAAPVSATPVAAAPPLAEVVPVEPPVNLEKLRLAESIETPIVARPRRAPKPAPDASQ